jgi:hypothetical protein
MQRNAKATSERVDVVRRARALLAVAELQTWTQAARVAGFKCRASVSHLVERFNQRGLVALLIAPAWPSMSVCCFFKRTLKPLFFAAQAV